MLRPKVVPDSSRDKLLQSLYDAIIITDEQGHILDANMRAESLLESPPDKLKRMKMADLFDDEIVHLNTQGEPVYELLERDFRRKDGTKLRLEIAISRIQWDKIQGRCYSLRDITRRKEMESALMAIDRAISNTANGIVITNRLGMITYANAAFTSMLGIENRSEITQMNIRECLGNALDEILACIRDLQACSSKTDLLKQDGSSLQVQLVCSPNLNSDGTLVGMVFCCEDITERLRIEKLTRQTQEQQIEKERIQARLDTISTLGYQLNGPLQTLLGMVELDKRDDYRREIDRIVNIVEELHEDRALSRTVSEDGTTRYQLQSESGLQTVCTPNTILIVDDEEAICSVFSRILQSSCPELTVETTMDGRQAVDSFKKNRHNIILLDIMMPDMTGEAVFHAIDEHCRVNRWEPPRMVFCSGFHIPDSINHIVAGSEHHAVLRKPISSRQLIETIERLSKKNASQPTSQENKT